MKKLVYMGAPGGGRARGGIGRLVMYVNRYWEDDKITIEVTDTYGVWGKWMMPFFFITAYFRLLAGLILCRYALVHLHMSQRASIQRKGALAGLARLFGVPVVMHLHGSEFFEYFEGLPSYRKARVRSILQACDRTICLGSAWKEFLMERVGLREHQILVLHNAVPTAPQEVNQKEEGACRILFLGLVSERKGVPILLQALSTPTVRALEWSIVLAGNGQVEYFKNYATELGLADRVNFRGWVDERGAKIEISSADIFVLPSRNEGLPMAILEAMAAGKCIVTTPVGSISDAIESGVNGVLVHTGDVDALAHELARLILSPDERKSLGETAKKSFLDRFEISAYNRKLMALYSTLVHQDV